jgi:Spy/CpxP family protein refolding chaperone
MDIFTRSKILLRIVFVLIFLNLLATGFLWFNRKEGSTSDRQPKRAKENTNRILKEKLHLTREQEDAFFALRNDFARKEEILNQLIRSQRDSMNLLMFGPETDSTRLLQIARRVAENEYQMELYRIEQAQKLKDICTKEQWAEFQNLVINIRDFFQPPKKKE